MEEHCRMTFFTCRQYIAFVFFFILSSLAGANIVNAKENIFKNSFGMEFVLIPSGSFFMGAADNATDVGNNEKPRHFVNISRPFYLSKYEVTQKQWEEVMGRNPFSMERSYPGRWDFLISQPGKFIANEKPATVSWEDSQAFIKRLNEIEGYNRYRLSTEAEWEYACRAGTNTAYSFGNNAEQLGYYAWYGEDFNTGSIHPVGKKEPNPWGLYDMHGNVWEWVQDWFAHDYYSISPNTDPQGPERGTEKVVRGGSWHSTASGWHSSFRKSYPPDYRGISIGFRLVALPSIGQEKNTP